MEATNHLEKINRYGKLNNNRTPRRRWIVPQISELEDTKTLSLFHNCKGGEDQKGISIIQENGATIIH